MTSAKHTPGPFYAWDDGRTIGIVAEPDGDPIAIAEIVDHGDMADEEQLLADQRLFASVLDLLDATKAMLACVKDALQDDYLDASSEAGAILCGDVMADAIHAAQKAIAKAEGRANG